MKLRNEFTVAAPLERTWETLLDVERVASCLPGASVEPVGQDGLYRGSVRVKAGPVTLAYEGSVRLADVDADDHVASFDARAKEKKGTGTAAATIVNRLEPAGEGTRVVVETELDVTGRPAQFGRGLMEDVAGKMLADFAQRLEGLVLEGPAMEPAAAGTAAGRRAAEAQPSPEGTLAGADEVSFDVASVLLRGYGRRLAIGAGIVALALAFLLGRRSTGLEITVRYRR